MSRVLTTSIIALVCVVGLPDPHLHAIAGEAVTLGDQVVNPAVSAQVGTVEDATEVDALAHTRSLKGHRPTIHSRPVNRVARSDGGVKVPITSHAMPTTRRPQPRAAMSSPGSQKLASADRAALEAQEKAGTISAKNQAILNQDRAQRGANGGSLKLAPADRAVLEAQEKAGTISAKNQAILNQDRAQHGANGGSLKLAPADRAVLEAQEKAGTISAKNQAILNQDRAQRAVEMPRKEFRDDGARRSGDRVAGNVPPAPALQRVVQDDPVCAQGAWINGNRNGVEKRYVCLTWQFRGQMFTSEQMKQVLTQIGRPWPALLKI